MKKLLFTILLGFMASVAMAGSTYNQYTGRRDLCVTIEEEDGSPSDSRCGKLKVTNGSLTDNSDGTYSLSIGSGTGSLDTTAIDTSAELSAIMSDEDGTGDCGTGKFCVGGHGHSDNVATTTTVTIAGTASEVASSAGAQDLSANRTWTLSLASPLNLSGKIVEVPNATSLTTADCNEASEAGRMFVDTDATSGQQFYVCEGEAGWILQGDGTGGTTALDDVGDPDAATSISLGDTETLTLATAQATAGGVLIINNSVADLTADVSLIDLKYTDDGDANGYFMRGYDNSGADLKWSIGADGAAVFSSVSAGSSSGVSMTSSNGVLTILGAGDGQDEDLSVDFNTTANTIDFTSSTGVNAWDLTDFDIAYKAVSIEAGALAAASVDGDDVNSNIAGRSLTLTSASPDTLDADAELYTDFKGMTIETPTDSDNFFAFEAPVALTVTRVTGIVEAATSAVLTWQECDSAGDNCSTIESVTADVDGTISTSIDNASIDAGDIIRLDVGTVTGTVGQAHSTITFTKND